MLEYLKWNRNALNTTFFFYSFSVILFSRYLHILHMNVIAIANEYVRQIVSDGDAVALFFHFFSLCFSFVFLFFHFLLFFRFVSFRSSFNIIHIYLVRALRHTHYTYNLQRIVVYYIRNFIFYFCLCCVCVVNIEMNIKASHMFVSFLTLLSSSTLLTECALCSVLLLSLHYTCINCYCFTWKMDSFDVVRNSNLDLRLSLSFSHFHLTIRFSKSLFPIPILHIALHIVIHNFKQSQFVSAYYTSYYSTHYTLIHTFKTNMLQYNSGKTYTLRSNPSKYSVKYTRISSKQRNK